MASELGRLKNPRDWKADLILLVQLSQPKTVWPVDMAEPWTTALMGQRGGPIV